MQTDSAAVFPYPHDPQSRFPFASSSSSPTFPYTRRPKHALEEVDEDDDAGRSKDVRQSAVKRRKVGTASARPIYEGFTALSLDGHPKAHPAAPTSAASSTTATAEEEPAIDMRRPERTDPSRPHVVFVDTLSDTDSDGEGGAGTGPHSQSSFRDSDFEEEEDEEGTLSGSTSRASSPGHETSSSSSERRFVLPSSTSPKRRIRINARLRDHLRKQRIFEYGPRVDEMLSQEGGPTQERGLVLYRPLQWVVEAPEEGDKVEETEGEDISIEELPDDAVEMDQPYSDFDGQEAVPRVAEVDEEEGMDID